MYKFDRYLILILFVISVKVRSFRFHPTKFINGFLNSFHINLKNSMIPPEPPFTFNNYYNSEKNPIRTLLFPFMLNRSSSAHQSYEDEDISLENNSNNDNKFSKLIELWSNKTRNSKGILIYLMPSLLNQLSLLYKMSIFLFDRLAQYLQPVIIALSLTLLNPKGVELIRKILYSSISLGGLFMLKDTISVGSKWAPLTKPTNDTYAVVTGYTFSRFT